MKSSVTRWAVTNGTMIGLTILGFGMGLSSVAVVVTFFTWAYFLLALIGTFASTFAKDEDKIINMPVPKWADLLVDFVMASLLMFTNHPTLAIIYILSQVFTHMVFDVRFPSDTK
jgi:hypothetical protein